MQEEQKIKESEALDKALDSFGDDSVSAPESELEIVQAFIRYKEDFKTDHRELGMANEELVKSLKVVETWLKTIEDIEADIEKKAKK